MSGKASFAMIAFIAATLIGTGASAHPVLKSADPPVGGATANSPSEIRITFNESLIAKFSGVELRDHGGRVVVTGAAATDPKDNKQLVVPIQEQLPPGVYGVDWHVVASDTHRVKGHYSFTVGP